MQWSKVVVCKSEPRRICPRTHFSVIDILLILPKLIYYFDIWKNNIFRNWMIYKLLIYNMFPYIQPFSHKTDVKLRITLL